jgi:hypothetical protein
MENIKKISCSVQVKTTNVVRHEIYLLPLILHWVSAVLRLPTA